MSDNFLGQIIQFGGNYAPNSWAFCAGQLLPISQNTALFSLLGTTFGGDGSQTYGLPDLRGRIPTGQGALPGGSTYVLGQMGGTETVNLVSTQMAQHSHPFNATAAAATSSSIAGNLLPATPPGASAILYTVTGSAPLTQIQASAAAVGLQGGSQPHENMMPTMVVSYVIAQQGIYPSRN